MYVSKLKSAVFENMPHFTPTCKQGVNDCRCFYDCDTTNAAGERLVIELGCCEVNPKYAKERVKAGKLDRVFELRWRLDTYVYDPEGRCYGAYNPCECVLYKKPVRDHHVIGGWRTPILHLVDFEWYLEATEENARKLFNETYRRFMEMEPTHRHPDSYVA